MINSILIADSGGSKTDWCFVNTDGIKEYFSTSSFHPQVWGRDFEQQFLGYFSTKENYKQAHVIFYGAGCASVENQKQLIQYFQTWGFNKIEVKSDLLGACQATLGNNSGVMGILGTGSVVCTYNGNEIQEIHGGLGYLLGDEGSGYYVGKLLLADLLSGTMNPKLSEILFQLLGYRDEILSKAYSSEGRFYIASLAKLMAEKGDNPLIEVYHLKNIQLFVQKYIQPIKLVEKEISFVGSYALFKRNLVEQELNKIGWQLNQVVHKPIESLTNYLLKR
jgi:glucosamine kinase